MQPGAVDEPAVDVRMGVVEPPAGGRGEPAGQPLHGGVVGEPTRGGSQPAPRSTRTSSGPLTTTSVVAGSASRSASGPAPTSSRCS